MRRTHAWIDWLRACLAAFQFLTRLPIPVQIDYNERVFQRSSIFYPLVGFVIGLILLFAGNLLSHVLPTMPAAVLLLTLWVVLTGGLHLDGLMDTADGILSHRPREQMLEIMKDSRVGAMGVIVCVLHLLLKFSLLYTMLDANGAAERGSLLILLAIVPIWSRWFMVAAIRMWPYARPNSGLGSLFRGVTIKHVTVSLLVALLSTTLLSFSSSLTTLPNWSIILSFMVMTTLVGSGMAAYTSSKLGGLTGDTYGALNELLESILLLAVIILIGVILV
ncbi:adenosylcobinamide-GDP ribazoletransferase [Paenibacillus qinlingensis]|uniref:Adenosylcobinamide-GDP ribazoletransferase n=1 Tax=Paenibacillus qinlingensis TaxID=1837343 RepID=A0ABU1P682_9BACL|nr:adenosylcobinamide-GDP ribazoletransferase [Paenibacillus qinlingensis]MDR6554557.1 cobalamin 5'-phosphate synthase/cobalamin synthase [Paenibacillus qinlingensis]